MSIIRRLFQFLIGENDDCESENFNNNLLKHKKTSQIVNKLEKGNNGIFNDEHEEDDEDDEENNNNSNYRDKDKEEDDEEDDEEDNDDDSNYRDKDKEAREKYINKIKKEALKKAGDKSGNKGDGKLSSKNLGKETVYLAPILKNMKLQMRIMRSKNRKMFRAAHMEKFIRIKNRQRRFLLSSHKRSLFRRKLLFLKAKKILGGIFSSKLLKNLINKRKINIKKAKLIFGKAKSVNKKMHKAKKMAKLQKANKDKHMKFVKKYQKESKNIEKGRGL